MVTGELTPSMCRKCVCSFSGNVPRPARHAGAACQDSLGPGDEGGGGLHLSIPSVGCSPPLRMEGSASCKQESLERGDPGLRLHATASEAGFFLQARLPPPPGSARPGCAVLPAGLLCKWPPPSALVIAAQPDGGVPGRLFSSVTWCLVVPHFVPNVLILSSLHLKVSFFPPKWHPEFLILTGCMKT